MKRLFAEFFGKIFIAFVLVVLLAGCSKNNNPVVDTSPPSAPTNVRTVVGDNEVDILWDYNKEPDVAGYNVYYASSFQGKYNLLGSTTKNFYVDSDAKNGELWYYAVVAYDFSGNESELSYDKVYGAPRPEGMNQSVFDFRNFPSTSGYDFSEFAVVPFNVNNNQFSADFFFENDSGSFYLNVWTDTEIQDMGATSDIYDIPYAPITGWVPLISGDNVKYVTAKAGHTYVVFTWDNHFAKIRIKTITTERAIFDWTYQLIEGEQQLKPKIRTKRFGIENKVLKNPK